LSHTTASSGRGRGGLCHDASGVPLLAIVWWLSMVVAALPLASTSRLLRGGLRGRGAGPASVGLVARASNTAGGMSEHRLSRAQAAATRDIEVDAIIDGARIAPIIERETRALGLDAAVNALDLPDEVLALLRHPQRSVSVALREGANRSASTDARSAGALTSVRNDTARAIGSLNSMILKAQDRLDRRVLECKEFREKQNVLMNDARADLARMEQASASSEYEKTTALSAINEAQTNVRQTKQQQDEEANIYQSTRALDSQNLKRRQHDIEVTEYLLELTRCKDAALLERSRGTGAGTVTAAGTATIFQTCKDADGIASDIRFEDQRISNATSRLTPEGMALLLGGIGRLEKHMRQQRLAGAEDSLDSEDATDGTLGIESRVLGFAGWAAHVEHLAGGDGLMAKNGLQGTAAKAPIRDNKQGNKCTAMNPDCGDLYDTFASVWGDMRDLVEDVMTKLSTDERRYLKFRSDIAMQMQAFSTNLGDLQGALSQASSRSAFVVEGISKKRIEVESLETTYTKTTDMCKRAVEELLYGEICGSVKVRDALINREPKNNSGSGLEDLVDCQVTDWNSGPCSKQCDDELKGGTRVFRREVLAPRQGLGTPCPPLTIARPCGQRRCPQNCELSEWSGFSQCTRKCGGGVESRSRTTERLAKYGGEACDVLQESRPCNSGACDQDCELGDWTSFSGCSKACNTGYMTRSRSVKMPAQGRGYCAKPDDQERLEKKSCNSHRCDGDEECLSKIDLVIALDSSGSVTEKGFEVLKNFSVALTKRVKTSAYGRDAARLGVVQFGNGRLSKDYVVTDAKVVSMLSADPAQVAHEIHAIPWQKGFTNMAQGIVKAKLLLTRSKRADAENVVILVSDGRPSFKMQTDNAVKALRETARLIVVHVQAFPTGTIVERMKGYASYPWQVNYIHVPGKKALKNRLEEFATRVVVKACPRVESPAQTERKAETDGFRKIREDETCGDGDAVVTEDQYGRALAGVLQLAAGPGICAQYASATNRNWANFVFGTESKTCIFYNTACAEGNFQVKLNFNTYEPVTTATTTTAFR